MKTKLCLLIFLLAAVFARAQTNDLTALLQQGLFEEQASRNLPAAISNYQALATQFDQDRQLAATAVFRLGECYRMQGKTNEAAVQYERVLKDFSDQTTLTTLSRQNLTGMGMSLDSAANSDVLQRLFAQRQKEMTIGNSDEESQEIQRIQTLIQNSPDLINAVSEGKTPLGNAAAHGWLKVAAFLLDHGADVNGGYGSALFSATKAGNRAMVELLLSQDANVNADTQDTERNTPLHLAAQKGFQAVVEVLLANKADVNAQNRSGYTSLFLAAQNNNPKIVSLLLEHKADVDIQDRFGRTPLSEAARLNFPEIVKLLLAAGANPNVEDKDGRTPLSYAAENGPPKMVKMLLAAKANPNGGKQDAPLLAAIYGKDTNSAELLLQAGANVNAKTFVDSNIPRNGSGYSDPLWLAIAMKQLPMVQLLLKFKADPDDSQTDGRPLLFNALDKPQILTTLLDAGAKVDARDETDRGNNTIYRRTALMMAASGANNSNAVEVLLQHGANANARDSQGRTALHWAACNAPADESVFVLLLNAKADPNVRNNYGKTPLDYIKSWFQNDWKGRFETVTAKQELAIKLIALLHQHGALDKLPDWNAITVSRPAANFSQTVFQQGTNDWNQFTLLETIFNFYSAPSGSNGSTFQSRLREIIAHAGGGNGKLPFPDLAHVTIVRPSHDSTNETRIEVNLLNDTNGIDCAKDVPLQFGDVVEIPERDHALGDSPVGLTGSQHETIADCLQGKVQLVTRGQKVELPIYPTADGSLLTFVIQQSAAQKVLLSSSDLSRVKVIRHNTKTGQQQELMVDCSDQGSSANGNLPISYQGNNGANTSSLATGLWLRDGDVIEVPEK